MKTTKWIVIHGPNCVHVIPETDVLPHGYTGGKKSWRLADLDCPCRPNVDFAGEKPIIVHHSFLDKKKIDDSMNKILNYGK
jgi:hypothetical protein